MSDRYSYEAMYHDWSIVRQQLKRARLAHELTLFSNPALHALQEKLIAQMEHRQAKLEKRMQQLEDLFLEVTPTSLVLYHIGFHAEETKQGCIVFFPASV